MVRGTSTLVPWTNPGLVGVSGTPLRVSGKAKLQLKLGEQLYPVEVVVANLRTKVLGLDFLETNRCAIDLLNGSMRLNGSDQLIPLYRTGETKRQMENVSIVLLDDVSIPGGNEVELEAEAQGEVSSGTMMIERRALLQKPSILLATSVVEMQKGMINPRVPMRLLNLSPDSVTMYKGTRVASGCTREADSIVVASIDSNSPSQDILSDHKQQQLWQVVNSAADKLTHAGRTGTVVCRITGLC